MNVESQKLTLIQMILALQDTELLAQIQGLIEKNKSQTVFKKQEKKKRQFGFAKGKTLYVAPDFDETPPGFEEYMPAASQ